MTFTRIAMLSLAAIALGLGIAQFTPSSNVLGVLTQAVVYAIFASGVAVLLRQNGLVSFGHALYFGAAGYGMGVVLALDWMPAELAIPVVLLAIGLFAFTIGLIIVRVPGIAFGMLTLAIGQMIYLMASRARGLTGGADGMSINWPSTLFGFPQAALLKPATLFLIAWVILVLVTLALHCILRTRFGITTTLPRAAVYALSAMVTGVAGMLSSLNSGFVSPESLHWSVSGITLVMVVVGGIKRAIGPIVGAMVYILLKDLLGDYATYSMAILGTALIAVIVFSPEGIVGALERLRIRLRYGPNVHRNSL
jgi:branched-chain amino acid transport system permease protein